MQISDGYVDTELAIILLEDDITTVNPLRCLAVSYDIVLPARLLPMPSEYDLRLLCL
jgi:hypothetical protein